MLVLGQWHDAQGWANAAVGQVRYAVRTQDRWTVTTPLSQPGPTESPQPLVGVMVSRLALSPDGSAFHIVSTTSSRDTDSIYNDGEQPLTLETMRKRGEVAIGP